MRPDVSFTWLWAWRGVLCGALVLTSLAAGPLAAQPLLVSQTASAQAPADWWVNIANDRVEPVRKALARGTDPNVMTAEGQPSIMQAIRDGAWGVYDLLAEHPALIRNAINGHRETPLMYLAVVGETDRARDLIRRGALVNRPGWTALHYAASRGRTETAQMLLSHRADVNARAPDGSTPLMMAAYGGSEETVQLLLRHGADLRLQDTSQRAAADWARLGRHERLAAKINELIARQDAPPEPPRASAQPSRPVDAADTSRYFDLDRDFSDLQP